MIACCRIISSIPAGDGGTPLATVTRGRARGTAHGGGLMVDGTHRRLAQSERTPQRGKEASLGGVCRSIGMAYQHGRFVGFAPGRVARQPRYHVLQLELSGRDPHGEVVEIGQCLRVLMADCNSAFSCAVACPSASAAISATAMMALRSWSSIACSLPVVDSRYSTIRECAPSHIGDDIFNSDIDTRIFTKDDKSFYCMSL